RAPGACIHGGHHKIHAKIGDGPFDGERTETLARWPRETSQAVRGDFGRSQGVRQNWCFESTDGKGGHNSHRRRHGEHLLESGGNSRWRKPGRTRQGRSRARTSRSGKGTRREVLAPDRRRGGG